MSLFKRTPQDGDFYFDTVRNGEAVFHRTKREALEIGPGSFSLSADKLVDQWKAQQRELLKESLLSQRAWQGDIEESTGGQLLQLIAGFREPIERANVRELERGAAALGLVLT